MRYIVIILLLTCSCCTLHRAVNYNCSYYKDENGRIISDYNTIIDFKNAYYRWPNSSPELLNYLSVRHSCSDWILKKAHKDISITYVSEDTCFVRGGYFTRINEFGVYVVSNPTVSTLLFPLSGISRAEYFSPSCFDADEKFIPNLSYSVAEGSDFQEGLNEVLRQYSDVIYERRGQECSKKYFVLCYQKNIDQVSIFGVNNSDNVFYKDDSGQESLVGGHADSIGACFLKDINSFCKKYCMDNPNIERLFFISLIGVNHK